jgi:hypothetical protein
MSGVPIIPLRDRLQSQPETLQEFELAAEQKYGEAIELMTAGYSGAGIYLMGYVSEMLLKVGYFRYIGNTPTDLIEPGLGVAYKRGQLLIPHVHHESYHSLRFWALLLVEERQHRNNPLNPPLEGDFLACSQRLYQYWWVEMRYRRDLAVPDDVETVYSDTTWLRDNHAMLWR